MREKGEYRPNGYRRRVGNLPPQRIAQHHLRIADRAAIPPTEYQIAGSLKQVLQKAAISRPAFNPTLSNQPYYSIHLRT